MAINISFKRPPKRFYARSAFQAKKATLYSWFILKIEKKQTVYWCAAVVEDKMHNWFSQIFAPELAPIVYASEITTLTLSVISRYTMLTTFPPAHPPALVPEIKALKI